MPKAAIPYSWHEPPYIHSPSYSSSYITSIYPAGKRKNWKYNGNLRRAYTDTVLILSPFIDLVNIFLWFYSFLRHISHIFFAILTLFAIFVYIFYFYSGKTRIPQCKTKISAPAVGKSQAVSAWLFSGSNILFQKCLHGVFQQIEKHLWQLLFVSFGHHRFGGAPECKGDIVFLKIGLKQFLQIV